MWQSPRRPRRAALLGSLFLPWYARHRARGVLGGPATGDVFTFIAVAVLALVALRYRWAALPAALLVGFWIVFPPDGLEPRTGAFIALGAALLATFAPRPEPAA